MMVFNSYIFTLCFLPIVIGGYFILKKASIATSKMWLIVASFVFYAYMNWKCAVLFGLSVLWNYAFVKGMDKFIEAKKRKYCMAVGVIVNIFVLFIYKYYDFFIGNLNQILKSDMRLLNLALPLGISFITFQQISFVVDCYKERNLKHTFLDYLLYISFFPKIVSGPIVLYQDFVSQLQDEKRFRIHTDNLCIGIYGFARGLAKKVLIADTLAQIVTAGYADIDALGTLSVIILILGYSLQLYYDFSGYSDMALGVAKMFNMDIPINFDSPYKAISVTDFWKRWHISLTRFFSKYVYIPLGGNRKGLTRTCINLMVVFLLSGLWHGANWTFLIWGGLHGLFMVLERIISKKLDRTWGIGRLGTFLFVNLAWLVFCSDSMQTVWKMLGHIKDFHIGKGMVNMATVVNELTEVRILCRFGLQGIVDKFPYLPMFLFIVAVLIVTFVGKNTQEKVAKFCFSRTQMVVTVMLLFWSIISLSNVSQFLYINF